MTTEIGQDYKTPGPYQIRQCENPGCRLRYPVEARSDSSERCPRCGAAAPVRLTHQRAGDRPVPVVQADLPPLEALLDNIRSTWNVGAMFRSADGAGFRRLHLCGFSATPDHPKVGKTALGAEKTVGWSYWPDGAAAAAGMKEQGAVLWALEDCAGAEPLGGAFPRPAILPKGALPQGAPLVLVVGNETCGVDPGILALCERVFYIPMLGVKRSFNAAVAFGIAAHWLRFGSEER